MKHRDSRHLLNALGAVALVAILVAPNTAQAQTAGEAKVLDKITVPGSRIARKGFTTPTPVTVLTAQEIRTSGAVSLGDLLNNLPALSSTFSQGNSSRFIGTVGLNLLDLRNLGTDRTLVLVNGRRHVGASAGTTSVDINTIPTDLVERIEVITGGASAQYGADAVTGVVNIVLKESFEGVSVRGQYNHAEDSDFSNGFVSLTAGKKFLDGKLSTMGALEFSHQDQLMAPERDETNIQYSLLGNPFGPPDTILTGNAGGYTITPGGRFVLGGRNYVFDPNGSFRIQNIGNAADGSGDTVRLRCRNCDFFNNTQNVTLQPLNERYVGNGIVRYTFSEGLKLFAEGKYARTMSEFASQPSFNNNAADVSSKRLVIFRDNAFLSPELGALLDANNARSINVTRINQDLGKRGEEVSRDTYRIVTGVEGTVATDWDYNASLVYGRMEEDRTNLNNRINDRFQLATDAVRNGAGAIVCRATIDPNATIPGTTRRPTAEMIAGCVPTSIFGDGAINQGTRNYVNTQAFSTTTITQQVASAYLTNSNLFQLPAGALGIAAGAEYRKEKSEQVNDKLALSGVTFLNAIPDQGGKYDVSEAFIEATIPLLSNQPLAKLISFDTAARYSHYSTIGDTTAYKFGLDWTMTDSLRLRAVQAHAIRAPNIGELFSPQSQNFFAITDPCSQPNIRNGADPALRAANCAALQQSLGYTPPAAGYVSTVTSTRMGLSGGEPNLAPEISNTRTIGLVFTPTLIKDFALSIDYWNIEIDDVISSTSGQDIVNRCVDSPGGIGNEFCGRARRDAGTFEVDFITQTNQNLSKLEAAGVDVEANYTFPVWKVGGKFNINLLSTWLETRKTFPFLTEPQSFTENKGVLGDPEWQTNLSGTYTLGRVSVTSRSRFISNTLRVSNESFNSNPRQQSPIETGSKIYTDLSSRYRIGKRYELYGGITNVAGETLPIGLLGNGGGSGIYENTGRGYFVGASAKF